MDCIEEGQIQKYIDGEVSDNERKRIEDHALTCKSCSQNIDEQKIISSRIVEALNLLFVDSIKQKHNSFQKIKHFPLKKTLYALTAASVLILAIAFLKPFEKPAVAPPQLYYELDWSVDANKPLTDQEFIIKIYDIDDDETGFSIH